LLDCLPTTKHSEGSCRAIVKSSLYTRLTVIALMQILRTPASEARRESVIGAQPHRVTTTPKSRARHHGPPNPADGGCPPGMTTAEIPVRVPFLHSREKDENHRSQISDLPPRPVRLNKTPLRIFEAWLISLGSCNHLFLHGPRVPGHNHPKLGRNLEAARCQGCGVERQRRRDHGSVAALFLSLRVSSTSVLNW
jgi:hypothetical protein